MSEKNLKIGLNLSTEDLYAGRGITGKIFQWERDLRSKFVLDRIERGTVLDTGSRDGKLILKLKEMGFKKVVGIDLEPKASFVEKGDVENLRFKDKSFDVVISLCVLEHVKDPVKAIKELKRVCKKQLFIAVPNEPFFSFWRFMRRCKEHLWNISPEILKYYLGKPKEEGFIALKREYIAVWEF